VEITDDVEFESAARAVLICAQRGDMAAAKLLFSYVLGKPAGVVDPDSLDQQEWQLYKQRPVKGQEFLGVLTNFPLDLAVYLLRAALPGMSGDMFRMLAEVFDKQKAREQAAKEEAAAPAPAAEPAREAPAEPETAEALRSRAEADAGVLEQLQAIAACLGGGAAPGPQPPSTNPDNRPAGPVAAAAPPSTNPDNGPGPEASPPSTNVANGPASLAAPPLANAASGPAGPVAVGGSPSTNTVNGSAPEASSPSTIVDNGLARQASPPLTNVANRPAPAALPPSTNTANGPAAPPSENGGNRAAPGGAEERGCHWPPALPPCRPGPA
jgi:hypothetical protein